MYPGQEITLPFDVKPASTNINWINVDTGIVPIINYGEVVGATGTDDNVVRFLEVEALNEGKTSITGMANGKVATVNIIVQYDYMVRIMGNSSTQNPEYPGLGPDYSGIKKIEYVVRPPNTYIKPLGNLPSGLEIEIMATHEEEDSSGLKIGRGEIQFKGNRELSETIQFQLYKPRNGIGDEVPVVVDGVPVKAEFTINYEFTEGYVPIPYFIRGDGVFSNKDNKNKPKWLYAGREEGEILSVAHGQGTLTTDGKVNGKDVNGIHSDGKYSVTLGDGEVHYILFDKKFETANMVIKDINNSTGTVTLKTDGDYEYTAELVTIKIDNVDRQAIRLGGGKDYIKYNRVLFDEELILSVKSKYFEDSVINTTTIPLYDDIQEDYTISYEGITGGGWYDVKNLPVGDPQFAGDSSHIIQCRALKNEAINKMPAKYFPYFSYIKNYYQIVGNFDDDRLKDYLFYRNEKSSLDLDSNERDAFNAFVEANCVWILGDKTQPTFYYHLDYYNTNRSLFDGDGTKREYREYDAETNLNVLKGYTSFKAYGATTSNIFSFVTYCYIYNATNLAQYALDNTDTGSPIDWNTFGYDLTETTSDHTLRNWDTGILKACDGYVPKTTDVDSDGNTIIKSTRELFRESADENEGGQEHTSHYNVFRDKYVTSDSANYTLLDGVASDSQEILQDVGDGV
jgi:hypothetical protein